MSPSARTPRRVARSRREQGLAGGLGGLIGGRRRVDGARGRRARTRCDRWHGHTMELHAVAIGGERRAGGSTDSSRKRSLGLQAGALLERGLGFRMPPKPPELGGVLPEPPELGGGPPEKPDGGPPLDPPRAGNFSPCLDRHAWKAENDFAVDTLCFLSWRLSAALPHRWCRWTRSVRAMVKTTDSAQSPKSAPRRSPRAGVPRRDRRVVFIGSECDRRICDVDPGSSRVS